MNFFVRIAHLFWLNSPILDCQISPPTPETTYTFSLLKYDFFSLIELRRRFEAPIEKNRWDFPLFRVRVSIDSTLATTRVNVSKSSCEESVDDSRVTTVQPIPLTSTKGQIDINCLTVDKVTKVEYRPEIVLDKVTAPISSSWRPKLKSISSNSTLRTFTTLSCDAHSTTRTPVSSNIDIHNNSSCNRVSPSTPLSISGSIPLIAPNDQALSHEVTMEMIYIHLTNVGQIAAPNSSTISVPRVNADLLHEIDRTTQIITQRIVTHQTENVEGNLKPVELIVSNVILDLSWIFHLAYSTT